MPRFPCDVRSNLLDRRALGQCDGGAAASCLVKSSERKWVRPDVIPGVMDRDPHLRVLNRVDQKLFRPAGAKPRLSRVSPQIT